MRPTGDLGDPEHATKTALRRLARRHQHLTKEITEAGVELKELVTVAAPNMLALPGVGTEVAGQLLVTAGDNRDRLRSEAAFAHLCGAAPIPASSGRTHRHRLNRGGDRAANNALYIVVLGRLRYDARARAYADRRTQQGLSKPEIIRCLSNRCWLVWCLLAGWLPALLDVTPAASGPSGSERWCLSFDSSVRRGWRRPVLFRWLDRRSSRMPPVTH
jgi:transposase